jgi:hypothetical protein
VTEAFEDIVEYLDQVLDFVENFSEMIEEFFSSALGDIEELIVLLNIKSFLSDIKLKSRPNIAIVWLLIYSIKILLMKKIMQIRV